MILAVRAIGDMNACRHRLPQCRTEIQYNIDVMMTSNFTQKMSKNAKSDFFGPCPCSPQPAEPEGN